MDAKVRISEKKTKRFLSFLEREYLRASLKGNANRAKYQIYLGISKMQLIFTLGEKNHVEVF